MHKRYTIRNIALLSILVPLVAACQPAAPTPFVAPTRTLAPPAVNLAPTATFTPSLTITPTPTITSTSAATAPPDDAAIPPTLTAAPEFTPPAPVEPPALISTPHAAAVALLSPVERLRSFPILANTTGGAVRAIFERGQAQGRRANVFTTVGDSNTINGDFLQPIGMTRHNLCTWGDYAYLQRTVAFFSVPPLAGASNSFTHESEAAQIGFNSAAVLDPFWASPSLCQPGEPPLLCEYRRTQPASAVIMLGGIDVREMEADAYRANMEQIVTESAARGIIPILTTFIVLPERPQYGKSLLFNLALLEIAERHGVPLINLWAAAESLPDHGIGPDRSHLKARVGDFCAFDGAERELGGTLRNLLTLQMLEALRASTLGT